MNATDFAAFAVRAQAAAAATFPCTLILTGGATITDAARGSWRKGAVLAEFGGGTIPMDTVTIRVLRTAVSGSTIKANATTATVDGISVRITAVRDMKNDPAILLECTATDPD